MLYQRFEDVKEKKEIKDFSLEWLSCKHSLSRVKCRDLQVHLWALVVMMMMMEYSG